MTAEDRNAHLTELDRLVEAELQTLANNLRRHLAGDRAAAAAARKPPPRDNVVRAHPLARRARRHTPSAIESLFAPDEAAFLANATDWLRGRPNADILLDALTRAVLEQRADSAAPITDAQPEQPPVQAAEEAPAPDAPQRADEADLPDIPDADSAGADLPGLEDFIEGDDQTGGAQDDAPPDPTVS